MAIRWACLNILAAVLVIEAAASTASGEDVVNAITVDYFVTNVIPKEVASVVSSPVQCFAVHAIISEAAYSIALSQSGAEHPSKVIIVNREGVWTKLGQHLYLAGADSSVMIEKAAIQAEAYGFSRDISEFILPTIGFTNEIVAAFRKRFRELEAAVSSSLPVEARGTFSQRGNWAVRTNWLAGIAQTPFLLTVDGLGLTNGIPAKSLFVTHAALSQEKKSNFLPLVATLTSISNVITFSNNEVRANQRIAGAGRSKTRVWTARLVFLLSAALAALLCIKHFVKKPKHNCKA